MAAIRSPSVTLLTKLSFAFLRSNWRPFLKICKWFCFSHRIQWPFQSIEWNLCLALFQFEDPDSKTKGSSGFDRILLDITELTDTYLTESDLYRMRVDRIGLDRIKGILRVWQNPTRQSRVDGHLFDRKRLDRLKVDNIRSWQEFEHDRKELIFGSLHQMLWQCHFVPSMSWKFWYEFVTIFWGKILWLC